MNDDIVKRLRFVDVEWSEEAEICHAAADEIERLREREATLREALESIATQSVPRPVAKRFRFDGTPSKFDLCPHELYMWGACMACVSNYARSALGEEEK